ncbi:MAG: hypothetical protein ACXQTI_00350 [Candidatus Nezhaarchaeales archaeon]
MTWCYRCGRVVLEPVVVKMPCPYCTTDVKIVLCWRCAKDIGEYLIQEADRAFRREKQFLEELKEVMKK